MHLDDFLTENLTALMYFLKKFNGTPRQNAMALELQNEVVQLVKYWTSTIFFKMRYNFAYPRYYGHPQLSSEMVVLKKFGDPGNPKTFNGYLQMVILMSRYEPIEFLVTRACMSENEINSVLKRLGLRLK